MSKINWSGSSIWSSLLRNACSSMHAWLARYTIVAGLSQTICCSEPPSLRIRTRVIQSGK